MAQWYSTWPKALPSPVLFGFAALLAIKLGILLALGPVSQPDTFGYLRYADAILTGETGMSISPPIRCRSR